MKSTKVLNHRLITPKTKHEHYDNAACHSRHNQEHKDRHFFTGLRYPIELWQKYSSTLHACSVTTQSLLSQVKGHQSISRDGQQKVHATST